MKQEDAMNQFRQDSDQALINLFNAGFEEGFASAQAEIGPAPVPAEDTTPFSQADIDAAIAPLQAHINQMVADETIEDADAEAFRVEVAGVIERLQSLVQPEPQPQDEPVDAPPADEPVPEENGPEPV